MTKLHVVRDLAPQTTPVTPTLEERVAMVRAFVDAERMRKDYKPGWFEEAEEELERRVLEIRRDLTAELIGAHDVDAPVIAIDGTPHRRVLRAAQTYMTAAGPVTAERWLYRDRDDDSQPAVSPVERRLGVVDFWSPKAAKQALWLVARMTPQAAAETSKSSLDRVPKKLSEVWEASREAHEAALRDAIVVPEGAVSIAVSIDGVLAPIDGGTRPAEVLYWFGVNETALVEGYRG